VCIELVDPVSISFPMGPSGLSKGARTRLEDGDLDAMGFERHEILIEAQHLEQGAISATGRKLYGYTVCAARPMF
jgi:hypothetical protein